MSTRKRRRKPKKKSVVDSAARNAASITDGCNPEFVKGATFDGIFEMPIIKKHGQLKNKVNRYYFKEGFDAMMETLEPEVVLVYSKLSEEWKTEYPNTKFVEYQDWASRMREE